MKISLRKPQRLTNEIGFHCSSVVFEASFALPSAKFRSQNRGSSSSKSSASRPKVFELAFCVSDSLIKCDLLRPKTKIVCHD